MFKSRFGPTLAAAFLAVGMFSNFAYGQSNILIQARAGSPLADRMRVDSSGAFVATGFVRDVLSGTGCAAQIPATGASTRFEWHPCRGSLRFGRVPAANPTAWDDNNMNDFTFAGGDNVVASGQLSFAYGNQVVVSSTVGVGFGSAVTVSGTAGFSSGAQNVCSGFACTAIGYTVRAGGQGSIALGYRTTANNDYSVAIGYRASNNTHTGTMAMGDESTTDSVRNQADNEFRIRYNGGIRLRVSTAANGNTPGAGGNVGCDITVAVPSWTCASSRKLKEDFVPVDVDDALRRLTSIPLNTWTMSGGDHAIRHIGPVAEDFYKAFPVGLGETTIGLGDIDGANMAAIQGLARAQAKLEQRTAELETALKELQASRVERAALEDRLAKLEARINQ